MKRYVAGAALIILFLCFTIFPERALGQPWRRPGRMLDRVFPFVFEDILDLSPEQKAQLEEMREMRLEERRNFQDKMRKMRLELDKLMSDPEPNENKIEDLIDEMAKLQADHFKSFFKHNKEVRKILTSEQLEKVDEARKKITKLRTMRPNRFFQQGRSFRRGPFPFIKRFADLWGRRLGYRGRGFVNPRRWR